MVVVVVVVIVWRDFVKVSPFSRTTGTKITTLLGGNGLYVSALILFATFAATGFHHVKRAMSKID